MPAAFSRKEISFAEFSELARSNSTKKVNFRIWPKLKRYENGPWIGNFSVPFFDSVGHIFEKETGLKLFESKYYDGFWRSIQREDEFDIISEWCKNWEDIIFIKDLLSISIALNYNFNSDGEYTNIGELEHKCKDKADGVALEKLVSLIYNFIATCLYYQEADAICAVPARPEKGYDLPTEIAKGLSEQLSKVDLTAHLEWAQQKVKLKELPLDERWKALERAQLNISTNVDKMDIILLDDLYQSGVTMHYVGRQLFEAGANSVYGISIVKSWRDTDNM